MIASGIGHPEVAKPTSWGVTINGVSARIGIVCYSESQWVSMGQSTPLGYERTDNGNYVRVDPYQDPDLCMGPRLFIPES